jgi:uncharacterized protein
VRWTWRIARAGAIGGILGFVLLTAIVTDNALHVPNRLRPQVSAAKAIARETGATWSDAQITASDGASLDAWYFRPRESNGSAVILLHGIGDTRLGTLGQAVFLLRNGFTVLTPDSRGHGASGGDLVTYGLREAGDVHAWADWLFQHQRAERLYGLGESLGAAILLQSLPKEPRFRAAVAESPFATFEEVAYDRLRQFSGLPKPVFWPVIHLGFFYARLRYGLDLWQASPAAAIRATTIPVLLIHGTRDRNIPPGHSEKLHALNPVSTRLWEIPGGDHVVGLLTEPEAYPRTVIAWFSEHR